MSLKKSRKARGRGPVVHLDRSKKARQIEAVATEFLGREISGFDTLDIGCGNGGISKWLANSNRHYGVDVSDLRKTVEGYEFHQVDDENLPFPDGSFDFVVSNHVIEHVSDQRLHLAEIRRVLRMDGSCYLATPNRTSPIMEGHVGNDMVLHYRDMAPLFQECGFKVTEFALRVAAEPARFAGEVNWARYFPKAVLALARPLFPSHIFMLTPA